MGSPPLSFFKHPLMATALPLFLLLLLSYCGWYSHSFSSVTLTLLVVLLSASFPFIFSKIKQLLDAGSMEEPPKREVEVADESKASQEEFNKLQIDELVLGSADASREPEGLEQPESNSRSPVNDEWLLGNPIADERLLLGDGVQIPSACLNRPVSDDESSPEYVCRLTGSSEGSISDDDSLIEIALPDGRYVGRDEPNALFRQGLGGGFLPESMFRQHGLVELLSEISEEENLIEIDIAMGSIKCSRFEIKA